MNNQNSSRQAQPQAAPNNDPSMHYSSSYGGASRNNFYQTTNPSQQYQPQHPHQQQQQQQPQRFTNNFVLSPVEKTYSIVNTEPTLIRKDRTPILVDPILERHIKSYLTWSLFNVLFCWCFGGIVTTIMSLKVMQLNDEKNYKAAFRLSDRVLLVNMIVTGVGVFLFLVLFPIIYIAIYPYLPKINW
jgi:hypothetical protein